MNGLKLNVDKTNIIEFKTQNRVNNKPDIEQYTTLNPKQSIKLLSVLYVR